MKNIIFTQFLFILLFSNAYANYNFAENIAQSVIQNPQIQSCIPGVDIRSDEFTYQSDDASGPLPYRRLYSTALAENWLIQDYVVDGAESVGGWKDNYTNFLNVSDFGGSNTNRIRFTLMLPGENSKLVYSADVVGSSIVNIRRIKSPDPIMYYSVERDGRSIVRDRFGTIGQMSLEHGDTKLIISTNKNNITSQSNVGNVEGLVLTVYSKGNTYYFENILRGGGDLREAVYKATWIKYATGKEIELSYSTQSGALNKVIDNWGNFIVFKDFLSDQDAYAVKYEYPQTIYVGKTQSTPAGINTEIRRSELESSQIIKNTYIKVPWINYKKNNRQEYIYTIDSVNSTNNGLERYEYSLVNPITFQVSVGGILEGRWEGKYAVPSLNRISEESPGVSKHTINYNSHGYKNWHYRIESVSGAGGRATAYRKLDSGFVNDNSKTYEKKYSVNIPGYNLSSYKIYGGTKSRLVNMQFSGFPCLTYNNKPVGYIEYDIIDEKINKIVDLNNAVTMFDYDAFGRLVLVREAVGTFYERQVRYVYNDDVEMYQIPIREELPLKTIINSLSGGKVVASEEHLAFNNSVNRISYSYKNDLISFVRFDDGFNLSFEYDNNGYLLKEVSSKGTRSKNIVYSGYNSSGVPSYTYNNGVEHKITFNVNNKPIRIDESGLGVNRTKSFIYKNQKMVSEVGFNGDVSQYFYNDYGFLEKKNFGDRSENYIYDSNLNLIAIEQVDGLEKIASKISYNSNRQVSERRYGSNLAKMWMQYTYDNNGNEVGTVQPGFNQFLYTRKIYDPLNRLSKLVDELGGEHGYQYDQSNNVVEITAPNLFSSLRKYQDYKELDNEFSNDFGMKTYKFTPTSLLMSYVHDNVRKCSFENYNVHIKFEFLKCTDVGGANSDYNVLYSYSYDKQIDRLNNVISDNNNGLGVNQFWGANTYYSYDGFNRISTKKQRTGILQFDSVVRELSVGYSYNAINNVTDIVYPSGRRIGYQYKAGDGGVVSKITYNGNDLMSVYYSNNNVKKILWGNGNFSDYLYDDSNLLIGVNNRVGFSKNMDFKFTYYNNGYLKSKSYNENSFNYAYDAKGRLVGEEKLSGINSIYTHTFQYDVNGNRVGFNSVGVESPYDFKTAIYGYQPKSNRYSEITHDSKKVNFNYESTGELQLPDDVGNARYDNYGRRLYQLANTAGQTAPHVVQYNHKNERVYSGLGTQFVYDETGNLLGEYNINGVPYVEYIWLGNKPIAAIFSDKIVYLISINNAPVIGVDSSSNSVVWEWFNDAFGVAKPTIENYKINLRFSGQYYESTTGLHYNLNRYYNPSLGRYMESDPIGMDGGQNTYTYVDNNPIGNIDPTGLQSVGQILDQNAMNSATLGNKGSLFGWAFAGTAWKVIGAESISLWADGQPTSQAGIGFELAAAVPFVGTFAKIATGTKVAGNIAKPKGLYSVYYGVDSAGEVRYVGITARSPDVRFKEHLNSIGTGKEHLYYETINKATNLSRKEARIIEQNLINQHGLGKNGGTLLNKINSISSKHWEQFGIK